MTWFMSPRISARFRPIGCASVADRFADLGGQRVLERRRCSRERVDLLARPRKQALQSGTLCPLLDPLLCALDDAVVHVRQGYRGHRMKTRELEYDLPPELIAQHPVALRDESRLLVYPRVSQRVHERRFAELPDVIGDALVVVNDTTRRAGTDSDRGSEGRGAAAGAAGRRRSLGRPGATEPAAATRSPLRAGRVARAPRRRTVAASAARRAGRRDAAAAVHHRAARRPGALPDRVCARRGLGRRADGRFALHRGGARAPRRRTGDAARRARHVPSGCRRRP